MTPAISHPLYYQFRFLARSSFRILQRLEFPFFNIQFIEIFRHMDRQSRGSAVGSLVQEIFFRLLDDLQPGCWRRGQNSEPDIVCLYNADWSFELKTSMSLGNQICGNRVQATARKPSSFLLFLNYYRENLSVREVRLGWVGPNDWQAGGDTSQRSVVHVSVRDQFVVMPEQNSLERFWGNLPNYQRVEWTSPAPMGDSAV